MKWFNNPSISCTKNQSDCESESGDTNSGFFFAPTPQLALPFVVLVINQLILC